MISANEIEGITCYAEQHYCKGCNTNPCNIFTSGEYEKCVPLITEYEKELSQYHTLLNSLQVKHVPGKCVFCRNEEINDKDTDYTLATLRYTDGKIRMRGYLCSYHYKQEWI